MPAMSDASATAIVVYALTALAALVVVLTRLRLRRQGGAVARAYVGRRPLQAHTVAGLLAVVVWTAFLLAPSDSLLGGPAVGVVGLGLWWVVALAGLMLSMRWLPSHGRHAADSVADSWSSGPALSLLAHVGMLLGVLVFSYAYLTGAV